MTIGTAANLAFAMKEIYDDRSSCDTRERLALLLIADMCAPGAAIVDLDVFARRLGIASAAVAHQDLQVLAQYDLLKVSANYGGKCFCALIIADYDEIQHARLHLDCAWPFSRGPDIDGRA